jgi:cytochrome c1
MKALLPLSTVALCLPLLAGCNEGQTLRPYPTPVSGNAERGRQIIEGYGCGACHTIPGVRRANGLVGPPLIYFSRRTMIAGELPNTQENLVRWIQHPHQVEEHTAMPDLGLDENQAYDVAAYLYTLR